MRGDGEGIDVFTLATNYNADSKESFSKVQ
jgi:hypothetical protein